MSLSYALCRSQWFPSHGSIPGDNHKLYKQKLEELTKLQDGISSSIARQKKQLKELSLSLKKCKADVSPEQEESIQETQSLIKERQNVFFEMEAYLPKKNGERLCQSRCLAAPSGKQLGAPSWALSVSDGT
uniref:Transmembrane protein 120A n=1 Tax=Strix occidentalis caurina TaxID=311401 RepID=A0A8D0EJ48_STROC